MTTPTYDITLPQGTTKIIPFAVTVLTDPLLPYDAQTNPRIPLDLSLAKLQCQIRSTYNTSTVTLTITDLNGRFVKTDPTNGEFEMRLVPEDTVDIRFGGPTGTFYYDIEAVFSEDNVVRIAKGFFILERQITRIS